VLETAVADVEEGVENSGKKWGRDIFTATQQAQQVQ
jgi:hypothetical protein